MKKTGFKIIALILLIIQLGIVCYIYFIFESFFQILPKNKGLIVNHSLLYAVLALLSLISLVFVAIIFFRSHKEIVYVSNIDLEETVKDAKDSKQKPEQDQKRMFVINEKKRLLVSEFTKNLNSQMSLENYTSQVLINISKHLDIFQGIFFVKDNKDGVFRKAGTYAYYSQDDFPEFTEGLGLTGQVATNKKLLNIVNLPDKYITVLSGLGKSSPSNLLIFPILYQDKSIGIVEIASFVKFDSSIEQVLTEISPKIGEHLYEINKLPEAIKE